MWVLSSLGTKNEANPETSAGVKVWTEVAHWRINHGPCPCLEFIIRTRSILKGPGRDGDASISCAVWFPTQIGQTSISLLRSLS